MKPSKLVTLGASTCTQARSGVFNSDHVVLFNHRFWVLLALLVVNQVTANEVKIHAPFKEIYSCTEHWDGQFQWLGDALGTDCIVQGWYQDHDRLFLRSFSNQGYENEEWYGFRKPVLAPCDCTVTNIHINPVTNKPGIMQPGRASTITFVTQDQTHILFAHVREVSVAVGDEVKAGAPVAKVGNNGFSRNPHIHIGAWNSEQTPLQIKFDQTTIQQAFRKPPQDKAANHQGQ